MIWLVVTIAAICGTFVAVLGLTGDIWSAANAAGAIVLAYLIVAAVWMTRPPVSTRARAFILGAVGLGLAGTVTHWRIASSTTNFQYELLQVIRRQIEHSIISAKMDERSLPVFAADYRERTPGAKRLAPLFDEMNPGIDRSTHLLDTLGEGIRVYAVALSDTEVVISGVSGFTRGRDRTFRNLDGRTGLLQSRQRLTPAGVDYAIEN